jgi:hypothetical protein
MTMKTDQSGSSEIRVRYSGFIIFASQIFSVFTGIFFLLLLTRVSAKTPDEFGTWSFIPYLIALFAVMSGLFPFWATRFAARSKEGAIKTGVVANLILAFVSAGIYLLAVLPIMAIFHVGSAYLLLYLLPALQIVDTYMIAVFEGSLRVVKPHAVGYGLIVEELTKISLAYVLIVVLNQLLVGAMISLILAAATQGLFYVWLLRDELRQRIQRDYLREWLRGGSAAFVYSAVGNQLFNLVLYLLVFFSGQSALGYYQAAATFSTVIGYASSLAFALYPKMLAKECPTDVQSSFNTMIMLALPIAAITFVMAQSLLTVLKVDYAVAYPILMLLTVDALLLLVYQFYAQCMMAADTIDTAGKIPISELKRTNIFKVFTIPYIQAAVALPAVYFALARIVTSDPVLATTYLVAISIVVHFGTLTCLAFFMRKLVTLPVARKSLAKYAVSATAAVLVLVLLPQTTTLTSTFGKALVGIGVYAGPLCIIDKDARKLVREIAREIQGAFRKR